MLQSLRWRGLLGRRAPHVENSDYRLARSYLVTWLDTNTQAVARWEYEIDLRPETDHADSLSKGDVLAFVHE